MFERRLRKAVLQEVGLNALYLASFISDDRYNRSFDTLMTVKTAIDRTETIAGCRLGRLSRPLWLGSDGIIYYRYGRNEWRRAELKRRKLSGLVRVSTAIAKALEHLLETSPGSMQYKGKQ